MYIAFLYNNTTIIKLIRNYNKQDLTNYIINLDGFNDINNRPDISFRRVGVNAGTIDREIDNKSHESHYFIKFTNPLNDEQYLELSSIDYPSKNNTVGPRSISKQELIKEFNVII